MRYLRFSLILPTFCCLEAIVYSPPSDWNRERRCDAQSLLLAMYQFPFVVALVLSQEVLAYTKGLSVKLQGRYVDVVRAHRDTEHVKTTIKSVWSRVDDFHSQLSQSIDVAETAPRQTNRQQHRQNIPSDNISDYYKHNLTIPILGSPQQWTRHSVQCWLFIKCNWIHVVATISSNQGHLSTRLGNFGSVLQLYGSDFPSVKPLNVELDLWQNKWTGDPEQAQELNTPEKVLAHTDCD